MSRSHLFQARRRPVPAEPHVQRVEEMQVIVMMVVITSYRVYAEQKERKRKGGGGGEARSRRFTGFLLSGGEYSDRWNRKGWWGSKW